VVLAGFVESPDGTHTYDASPRDWWPPNNWHTHMRPCEIQQATRKISRAFLLGAAVEDYSSEKAGTEVGKPRGEPRSWIDPTSAMAKEFKGTYRGFNGANPRILLVTLQLGDQDLRPVPLLSLIQPRC
jgi:hypothetical protein